MPKRRPILIGCPQYRLLVRGTCECDERGNFRRTEDGHFPLESIRCGHYGGRCTQTLCVLHRYNRAGPGSWYPAGVWAMRDVRGRLRTSGGPIPATGGGWYA